MKTATIVLLVIVALLLLYIANEIRKGKSVVFVFGNFNPSFDFGTATVDRVTPSAVISNAIESGASSYNQGINYGKSVLENMTGWKTR